jgi:hypothetical protein
MLTRPKLNDPFQVTRMFLPVYGAEVGIRCLRAVPSDYSAQ